jgi:hypothetical protein
MSGRLGQGAESASKCRTAAAARAAALEAATALITHNVRDLSGLIDLLEVASGSTRLVEAPRRARQSVQLPIGQVRPEPAVWNAAEGGWR